METFCLPPLSHSFKRLTQTATDLTRTTIQNIQAAIVKPFLMPTRSTGGRAPAASPNLNPIKKVWGSMKNFLRDKHQTWNMTELKEGIKKFWKTLTPDTCSRNVDHLQKVMPDVIKVNGAPFGH